MRDARMARDKDTQPSSRTAVWHFTSGVLQALSVLWLVIPALGGLQASQSSVLSALGKRLDDQLLATVVNSTSALIIATTFILPPRVVRLYSERNVVPAPYKWWMNTNGTFGVVFITIAGISVSKVGVLVHTIGFDVGLFFSAALIDHIGPLDMRRYPMTLLKALSISLVVAGIVLACWPGSLAPDHRLRTNYPYVFVSFLGGVLLSVQNMINISVSLALPYKAQANWVNFAVAEVASLTLWTISYVYRDLPPYTAAPDWWMLFPGAHGVLYVLAVIVLVPLCGLATFNMLFVTGQMAMCLTIDSYGLLQVEVTALTLARLMGALLMVCGTAVDMTRQCCVKMDQVTMASVEDGNGKAVGMAPAGTKELEKARRVA